MFLGNINNGWNNASNIALTQVNRGVWCKKQQWKLD